MIQWWVLVGVAVLLLFVGGAFIAGRVSNRRRSVDIVSVRYVHHNDEVYLSATDLAVALRKAGQDDLASTMRDAARAAEQQEASSG